MTSHTLPLPPSANALVRPAILGKICCPGCHLRFVAKNAPVRLVKTQSAKDFREAVHEILAENPIDGPVEIFVTVYVDTIASDGRNREKALDDALSGRLYYDDKQIAEWHGCKIVGPATGIVVDVVPADPVKHAELARRLAASKVGEQAAERAQAKLEFAEKPPTWVTDPRVPESLRDRLMRLAKSASYPPPPPSPPEAA